MNNLITYLSFAYAFPDKLFSLRKCAVFPGLDLYKDHLIHFSFGKPVKDDEVHRGSEKSRVLGVVFEVRKIRDKVFCDLSADYGFAFLYCVLADFFSPRQVSRS